MTYQDKLGKKYTNIYFPAKQQQMCYPKVVFSTEIVPMEGGYEVTLRSDVFARGVYLTIEGDTDHFISDNYFDLMPQEDVKLKVDTKLSLSEFEQNLKVASFSDMYN